MNTRFQKKPELVDAFQMTKGRRESNKDWPEWMHEAWNRERGDPGALYPTTKGAEGGTRSLTTPLGDEMEIFWGDYIVRTAEGKLAVYNQDAFETIYEPAPPASAGRTAQRTFPEMAGDAEEVDPTRGLTEYRQGLRFLHRAMAKLNEAKRIRGPEDTSLFGLDIWAVWAMTRRTLQFGEGADLKGEG